MGRDQKNDEHKSLIGRILDDIIIGAPCGDIGFDSETGDFIPKFDGNLTIDKDGHMRPVLWVDTGENKSNYDWDDDDDDDFNCDDDLEGDEFDDDCGCDYNDGSLEFTVNIELNPDMPDFNRHNGSTTEEQYYDPKSDSYYVGRAIRDHFKEIAESFTEKEADRLLQCLPVIYASDKKLALDALNWAVKNFPKSLNGATCASFRCGLPTVLVLNSFTCNDNEDGSGFVYNYLREHPDFEKAVVGVQPFELPGWVIRSYLPYLAGKGDVEKFIEIYKMFFENPHLDPNECSKFKVLDELLSLDLRNCGDSLDHRLYSFLKSEAESLNAPLKTKYLLGLLEYEEYGEPLFEKPPKPGEEKISAQAKQAKRRLREIENEADSLEYRLSELNKEREKLRELLREAEEQPTDEDDI